MRPAIAAGETTPPDDPPRGGDRGLWQRSAGRPVLRALSILVGLVGAGAILVYGVIGAVFVGCPIDPVDESGLCRSFGAVIDVAEIGLAFAGALAVFAGGVLTCISLRARFLAWGLVAGGGAIASIVLLAQQQVGLS